MESLASLAAAAAAGDAVATGELLRLAWPDAYRIAWSVLRERTASEDAAQEACARVITAIKTLRRPERFAPWFYRIVVNEAKRRRREVARKAEIVEDVSAGERDALEERIDVRRALDTLDEDLQIAVVLRYYFGLNSAEIGAIVGATAVTVRWRLLVARRRLQPLLAGSTQSATNAYVKEERADELQAAR